MDILREIQENQMKKDVPDFGPGDTVKVDIRIKEGKRERIQVFEGVVLKRQGGGLAETFTVRKISFGVGVEKILPIHSPLVEGIKVVRQGNVRRARINYLRQRSGKAARIKEKISNKNNA